MNRVALALAVAIELLVGQRPLLLAQAAPLTPPRQVWAAQTGSKEITLVWKRAPDAEGYRVAPVGSTPKRAVPTGQLARNVDRLSISLYSPFGASYSYQITAVYPGGRLSRKVQSNTVVPVAVQPGGVDAPPAQVEAKETKPGIVTITWTPVPSATAYLIGRSVQPEGFKMLCPVCSTTTTYVDRKVTAGAKHIYAVAALTPKGPTGRTQSNPVTPTGESSDTAEADSAESVAAGPPEAPKNVTVVAASAHSFELSWDRAVGATGYEISRRVNNGEPRVLATTSSTTRYVDNQASADPKGGLSYGVTALNSNGRSEEVVATVHDSTSADAGSKAAIDLKAAKKSANSVLLTWGWGGVGGLATGHRYALHRRVGGGLPSLIATISGTMSSFVDQLRAGITGNLAYFLEDLDGKGPSSNQAFVTIDIAGIDSAKARNDSAGLIPPGKGWTDSMSNNSKGLVNASATVLSPTSVRLTIDAARAMLIRILRRIAGGPFVEVGRLEGGIPAFIDNLPPGALGGGVAYSIEASNGKGLVEKASVTIDPAKAATESTGTPTATNPEARITSEGSVSLSWGGSGAASYQIERSLSGGTYELIASLSGTVYEYLDELEGLLQRHPSYRIIAVSPTGASQPIPFTRVFERGDSLGPPKARSQ